MIYSEYMTESEILDRQITLESEIFIMEIDYENKFNNRVLFEKTEDSKNIFNRLKEFVEKIFKKLKDFLDVHFFKNKTDIEEKLKNKNIANKKIKINDTETLIKFDKHMLRNILNSKTEEDLEKKMDRYEKERKIILASLPIITITVASAFKKLNDKRKRYKDQMDNELAELEKCRSKMHSIHINSSVIALQLNRIYKNFASSENEEIRTILRILDGIKDWNSDNKEMTVEIIEEIE